MSHSYKHTPICKDDKVDNFEKTAANRRVRREKFLPLKGSNYKKLYPSWDINDYVSYYSLEQAIRDYESPDVTDLYIFPERYGQPLTEYLKKHWYKYYRRK